MKRLMIFAALLILIPAAMAQWTPDLHQFYGDVNGAQPGDRIDIELDPPIAMPIFTYVDSSGRYGYNPLLLLPVNSPGAEATFMINGSPVAPKQSLVKYAATELDLVYSPGVPSHCLNGMRDASLGETDVDCGGPCPRCDINETCNINDDCITDFCDNGICKVAVTNISHCTNNVFDPSLGETDLDCGGPCPGCSDYDSCGVNTDCLSGLCLNGTCYPGYCGNSAFDFWMGESDVDCGGPCPACINGLDCYNDSDCASGNCENGTCTAPPTPVNTCSNGIMDGDETDVDCGGSCPRCANGKDCLTNSDCKSGRCKNGVCRARQVSGGGGGGGGGGFYTPWALRPTTTQDDLTAAGDVMCAGTWECGDWRDCQEDNLRRRKCVFIMDDPEQMCTLRPAAPVQVESCVYRVPTPEPIATCYDGIRNQGETGVDCGGPCPACYVPPIETPKEEPKRTPWIILGAVLLAIIIGVVAWMALKPPKVSDAQSYVKSALSRGFTEKDIASKMKQAGYTPAQIKKAMKK